MFWHLRSNIFTFFLFFFLRVPLIIAPQCYKASVLKLVMYFQGFGQDTEKGVLEDSELSLDTTDSEVYLSESTDSECCL